MSLSHVVEQFANSMENQMDLTQEAANMNRFIQVTAGLTHTYIYIHICAFKKKLLPKFYFYN
jgi:predicted unusual protein kinase regulating ubiquinone biosynthesis (AarF/ABC1/UbiB family)